MLLLGLALRDSKHKLALIGGVAAIGLVALPLLPSAFSSRMNTIGNYQSDESASTPRRGVDMDVEPRARTSARRRFRNVPRQPVAGEPRRHHPRPDRRSANRSYPTPIAAAPFTTAISKCSASRVFPALCCGCTCRGCACYAPSACAARYKGVTDPDQSWIRPLASAVQGSHCVYLLGSMFVGIAFQPFVYMLIALQIALWTYIKRREEEARWRPIVHEVAVQIPTAQPANGGSRWRPAG